MSWIGRFTVVITLTPSPCDLNNNDHKLYSSKLMTGSWAPKAHPFPWGPKARPSGLSSKKSQYFQKVTAGHD